jgi:hypothetical protein
MVKPAEIFLPAGLSETGPIKVEEDNFGRFEIGSDQEIFNLEITVKDSRPVEKSNLAAGGSHQSGQIRRRADPETGEYLPIV